MNGKCAAPKPNAPVCDVGAKVAGCLAQCDAGDATGCTMASLVYGLGVDVPKDDAKATSLDKRGCELGDLTACWSYGVDFQSGTGVAQDKPKAAEMFLKVCSAGLGQACSSLARMYSGEGKMGFPADPTKMMKYAERGCDAGDGQGCAMLAHGTPDKAKALHFLRLACDGNDSRACMEAGAAYEKGDGATADPAKAKPLYKRACTLGHKAGCEQLKKLGG